VDHCPALSSRKRPKLPKLVFRVLPSVFGG
jgi:hypothetical protein